MEQELRNIQGRDTEIMEGENLNIRRIEMNMSHMSRSCIIRIIVWSICSALGRLESQYNKN